MLAMMLLIGLVGGVVLAAAAGARRTDTAYPRLLRWASAAQVNVLNGPRLTRYDAALARLPQVASTSTASVYNAALPARHGLPQTVVETFSSPGRALGVSADRVKILQGRMFNPRAAGQAMIDQQLAGLEHLRPGGTLHLLVIPDNPTTGNPEPRLAVPLAFRVSAVVAFDSQIVPATKTNSEPMALLGSPFTGTRLARLSSEGIQTGLRLRPGASMADFLSAAAALAKRHHIPAGAFNIVNLSDEFTTTERAIRPEAIALAAFAALLALIALATVGQLLRRQLILDAAEFPILRALGMTRARLAGLSLARVAAVTIAGAAISVAVAIAASPLMPIGRARLAEPGPGVEINVTILGAGLRRHRSDSARRAGTGSLAGGRPDRRTAGGGRARGACARLAAGPYARAGRLGHRQCWRADGVRAGPWPDRRAGAQRPGRHHRGCRRRWWRPWSSAPA